jgi:UDP-N-acetylmuramate: L-alanyl-gamma-D-glutamyl-meso-diaminopimelate ligase
MSIIFNLELKYFIVKIHLIAIGGSAMHNMAIALSLKGYKVSGSDDTIFNPSRSRLEKYNLLPEKLGWHPEKIDNSIDEIILGMHAREDNPELIRAKELNIPIYSYPEYIYNQSKDKKRIVIGGSHGKTSITAMILHVLNLLKIDCDYMVGAQLSGFEAMFRLTKEAPIIILEGDEYLSSPIDRRPKFHWYKPDIAVLSGIAWDHINVFPTFDNYVEQFRIFKDHISDSLIYCEDDVELCKLAKESSKCQLIPYSTLEHYIKNGQTFIKDQDNVYSLEIFGDHNIQNCNAAKLVCNELGVSNEDFYTCISSFKGAANRLELVKRVADSVIYKDFAHSPSKLKATTKAMKQQFKNRELVACMELHTFSSLNKEFLDQYKGSMDSADVAIVFFSEQALAHKKLESISKKQVLDAFGNENVKVFNNNQVLLEYLSNIEWKNKNLLMMSSGTFDGLSWSELSDKIN